MSFFLWNARSLLKKSQELQTHLRSTLPSIVGLIETWLIPNISLNIPGYAILRKECPQGREGGVLLTIRYTIPYMQLHLPTWQGGQLEVIAAILNSNRGRLTVATFYNPTGTVSYQEFSHYFSTLPPPVIAIGDFNAHHQCWESGLLLHHTNTSGRALF